MLNRVACLLLTVPWVGMLLWRFLVMLTPSKDERHLTTGTANAILIVQ